MSKKYYVLQHKKIYSVFVWNENIEKPDYLKFKSYWCAFAYKMLHSKWKYKVVKMKKDILEVEV